MGFSRHDTLPGSPCRTKAVTAGYLASLGADDRERLHRVNHLGLKAWCGYLKQKSAVAFLGEDASSPVYPTRRALVRELVTAAVEHGLDPVEANTWQSLAVSSPDVVVEHVQRYLGIHRYIETMRQLQRPRDASAGCSQVQSLVCRLPFRGVVTTATDPGLLAARDAVRAMPDPSAFTTWDDEWGLDRWRTEEVFHDHELPVLYAHGVHSRPENVVLSTSDYRRAYGGRLSAVLADLLTRQHMVWIGFSFDDPHIATVLRQVQQGLGGAGAPGGAPRHIAVMPWRPGSDQDPMTLRRRAEVEYNADLVLYPADDPHALERLLAHVEDTSQREESAGATTPTRLDTTARPGHRPPATPAPPPTTTAGPAGARRPGRNVVLALVIASLETAIGVLANQLRSTRTAVTAMFAVVVVLLLVAVWLDNSGSWRSPWQFLRRGLRSRWGTAFVASLATAVVLTAGFVTSGYPPARAAGDAPGTSPTPRAQPSSSSPAASATEATEATEATGATEATPLAPEPSFRPVVDKAAAQRYRVSLTAPTSGGDVGQCAFVTVTATLPPDVVLMSGIRKADDRGDVHLETLAQNGRTWSGRQYFGGGDSARGQSFTLYVLVLPRTSLPGAIDRSVWNDPDQIPGATVVTSADLRRISGRGPEGCLG